MLPPGIKIRISENLSEGMKADIRLAGVVYLISRISAYDLHVWLYNYMRIV